MQASVFTYTISEGRNSGKVVGFIDFYDAQGTCKNSNEVLEKAMLLGHDTYIVKGSMSATPELIEIVKGLNNKGIKTVFYFSGKDDIGVLRFLQRNSFFADITPTTDAPMIHPAIISLLAENDEVRLAAKTLKEYTIFKNFLVERLMVKPLILFNFDDATDAEMEILIENVLNDAKKMRFQFRFSGHKTQMLAQEYLLLHS